MKIIVVGTGYVGLVHAAVCSEYGHDVHAYDIDKEKIEDFASDRSELIEKHVNEPGLVNIISSKRTPPTGKKEMDFQLNNYSSRRQHK